MSSQHTIQREHLITPTARRPTLQERINDCIKRGVSDGTMYISHKDGYARLTGKTLHHYQEKTRLARTAIKRGS